MMKKKEIERTVSVKETLKGYSAIIDDTRITEALNLVHSSGFSFVHTSNDVTVEELYNPTSEEDNIVTVRMSVTIDGISPKIAYEAYDSLCEDWKIVEIVDEKRDISMYTSKKPFVLVSGREFCTSRYHHCDEDYYMVVNINTSNDKIPIKEGYVRGYVFMTVFYFCRVNENQTKFVYVTKSDMGGWIPSYVVNSLTKFTAPSLLKKVKVKVCEYEQWKKNRQESEL